MSVARKIYEEQVINEGGLFDQSKKMRGERRVDWVFDHIEGQEYLSDEDLQELYEEIYEGLN